MGTLYVYRGMPSELHVYTEAVEDATLYTLVYQSANQRVGLDVDPMGLEILQTVIQGGAHYDSAAGVFLPVGSAATGIVRNVWRSTTITLHGPPARLKPFLAEVTAYRQVARHDALRQRLEAVSDACRKQPLILSLYDPRQDLIDVKRLNELRSVLWRIDKWKFSDFGLHCYVCILELEEEVRLLGRLHCISGVMIKECSSEAQIPVH